MNTNFCKTAGQISIACLALLALPNQTHAQTLTAMKSFALSEHRALERSVIVRWPVTALNVQLEGSTNFLLANGWSVIGDARSTNNGFVSVTMPAVGSGKFFRLSSP